MIPKEETGILTPKEVIAILKAIDRSSNQIKFKFLLFSGMRYSEAERFHENPKWFNSQAIILPDWTDTGNTRSQKGRTINLTPRARDITAAFLSGDQLPSRISWNENLKRWARKAGIIETNNCAISVKSIRNTWDSWLVSFYPSEHLKICLSQGYDSISSIQDYLNIAFTEEDKVQMKEFVEGWLTGENA